MNAINWKKIDAVFFDINGVLLENGTLIQGSIELIRTLKKQHKKIRLISNTISISTDDLYIKLKKFGLDISRNDILSALDVCQSNITSLKLKPYCVINTNIKQQITHYPSAQCNCVLIGDAREQFSYTELNTVFNLLNKGLHLYSLGDNQYFKSQNQLMLDSGAFLHLLQRASKCEYTVFGKPGLSIFNQAIASVNVNASHCLMIGDDIYGDLQPADQLGMQTILVKTGKYQLTDEHKLTNPTPLFNDVAHILTQCDFKSDK